jgi:hypothetical protein
MSSMTDEVAPWPAGVTTDADIDPGLKRHAAIRDRGVRRRTGAATDHHERTAMAALCRAYSSEHDAHDAVDRLLSAGIAGTQIHVLMGEAAHDSRDAPVGGYAGGAKPFGEVVGSYAGAAHSAREAMGTFAGDADAERRGGFSDVDRETVTTYAADVKRVRIASHHALEKMLIDAGLDETAAEADVQALHQGRVMVLVQSAMELDEIAAAIDG